MKTRRRPMTFKVPPMLRRWTKAQAKKAGQTPSEWVYHLIREKHDAATNGQQDNP